MLWGTTCGETERLQENTDCYIEQSQVCNKKCLQGIWANLVLVMMSAPFGFNCAQRLSRELLQWDLKLNLWWLGHFANTFGRMWRQPYGSPASARLHYPPGYVFSALESEALYNSIYCLLGGFETRDKSGEVRSRNKQLHDKLKNCW